MTNTDLLAAALEAVGCTDSAFDVRRLKFMNADDFERMAYFKLRPPLLRAECEIIEHAEGTDVRDCTFNESIATDPIYYLALSRAVLHLQEHAPGGPVQRRERHVQQHQIGRLPRFDRTHQGQHAEV